MPLLENLQPANDECDPDCQCVQRTFAAECTISAIKILKFSPNTDEIFFLKWRAHPQNDSSLFAVGKNRIDLLLPDIDARISFES